MSETKIVNFGYVFYHLGTGKSSIVCAICLGLGGSPNLLGRAKDVSWHWILSKPTFSWTKLYDVTGNAAKSRGRWNLLKYLEKQEKVISKLDGNIISVKNIKTKNQCITQSGNLPSAFVLLVPADSRNLI